MFFLKTAVRSPSPFHFFKHFTSQPSVKLALLESLNPHEHLRCDSWRSEYLSNYAEIDLVADCSNFSLEVESLRNKLGPQNIKSRLMTFIPHTSKSMPNADLKGAEGFNMLLRDALGRNRVGNSSVNLKGEKSFMTLDDGRKTPLLFHVRSLYKSSAPATTSAVLSKVVLRRRVVNQTRMGKNVSVHAVCIAGNLTGLIGIGEGKAAQAEEAARQSRVSAVCNVKPVIHNRDTILGAPLAHHGGTTVELRGRPSGFGIRTQHIVHELCRAAGINDITSYVRGSRNKMNVIKCTFRALTSQVDPFKTERVRSIKIMETNPSYYDL